MLDSASYILPVFHLHLKGSEERLLGDKLGAMESTPASRAVLEIQYFNTSTYKYHFREASMLLGKPSLEESQFVLAWPLSFNIAKYKFRYVAHPKVPLFRTLLFLFVYFKVVYSCMWSSFLFSPPNPMWGGNPLMFREDHANSPQM